MSVLVVAWSGIAAIRLHKARSAVTVACLILMLAPYAIGLGISSGVRKMAEVSLAAGADLYISGKSFGRVTPIPLSVVPTVQAIDGVESVRPRIVGRLKLGRERVSAVVVGLDTGSQVSGGLEVIEGRAPQDGSLNELVIGSALARRLALRVGSVLPPFYKNRKGERLSKIVGIFRSQQPMWELYAMFTTFQTAAHLFDNDRDATDLVVKCRPGYEAAVVAEILRGQAASQSPGFSISRKTLLEADIAQNLTRREGVFGLFFVVLFVQCIFVFLVTSAIGSNEIRREVAILKATGWQTDQVLIRSFSESVCLAILGGSLAILLSFIWIRLLGGIWIVNVFIPDWPPGEGPVPFQLTVFSQLLVQLVSMVCVVSGALYSSWRSAVVLPLSSLRS